ncbi:MAG: hypothetical protein ACLFST_08430 [Spirochaetia bacterium]
MKLTSEWSIVILDKPGRILETAVRKLKALLKRYYGTDIPFTRTEVNGSSINGKCIILKTTGGLSPDSARNTFLPESIQDETWLPDAKSGAFSLVISQDVILLTGYDTLGVLYSVVWLGKLLREQNGVLPERSIKRTPFFTERSGGILFAQPVPPGYTEAEYAEFLTDHFINYSGTHQGRTHLPAHTAEDYGIARYGGGSSNFFYNHFDTAGKPAALKLFEQWKQEYPDAVNEGVAGAEGYQKPPVLCVRSEFGREKHAEWLSRYLAERPGTKRLLFTFGDWGSVCGDECPVHGKKQLWERISDWLAVIDELVKKTDPEVKVIGRVWYYDEKIAEALLLNTPKGIGIRMKEPSPIDLPEPLGHTKYADAWGDIVLYSTKLSHNFGPVYLSGGKHRGEDFYTSTGVGDTEEAVAPLIGMAMPWIAAKKINRLAENGITNLGVWWGGLHGWTYSVHHEVIAEMVWDPFQDIDAMITRIAERDFPGAPEIALRFWKQVDAAMGRMKYITWKQQFETFFNRAGKVYTYPLVPENVTDEIEWIRVMKLNAEFLLPVLEDVVPLLEEALVTAKKVLDTAEAGSPSTGRESFIRALDQYLWFGMFTCAFRAQKHTVKAILLRKKYDEKEISRGGLNSGFIPVVRKEILNIRKFIEYISHNHIPDTVTLTAREQGKERVLEMFQEKLSAMQEFLTESGSTSKISSSSYS